MVQIPISAPPRLDGQVALVTGAAGGIGSEVVRTFLAAGATVIATDIAEEHPFAGEAQVDYQRYDVTSAEDTERVVAAALAKHGRIDILVACAGEPPPIVREILRPPKLPLEELLPRVVGCWELQPGPWSESPGDLNGGLTSSAPRRFRLTDIRLDPADPEFSTWGPVFRAKALDGKAYETFRYWSQVDGRAHGQVTSGDIGFQFGFQPRDSATLDMTITLSTDYGPTWEVSRRGTAKRVECTDSVVRSAG